MLVLYVVRKQRNPAPNLIVSILCLITFCFASQRNEKFYFHLRVYGLLSLPLLFLIIFLIGSCYYCVYLKNHHKKSNKTKFSYYDYSEDTIEYNVSYSRNNSSTVYTVNNSRALSGLHSLNDGLPSYTEAVTLSKTNRIVLNSMNI